MRRGRPGFGAWVAAAALIGGVGLGVYSATFWSADAAWAGVLAVASFAAIITGVGLFAVGARRRTNLSLALASVVAVVFVAEAGLSLRSCGRSSSAKPGFDTRTPLEVVRDLRDEGIQAVPALLPTYVKQGEANALMPLGGVATATTVFCNESGEYVIYASDEYGFNNPTSSWRDVEIVLIGDSFAHGQCVERGDELASRLRTRGHRTTSLGMAGNGPLTELAALTEYGLDLHPEVVVWLYYENDVGDLAAEMRSPKLTAYLDPSHRQGLIDRQSEIDAFWETFVTRIPDPEASQRAGWKAQLKDIARLKNVRGLLGLRRAAVGSLEGELARVLQEAKERVEGEGARLVLCSAVLRTRARRPLRCRCRRLSRVASRARTSQRSWKEVRYSRFI